MVWSCTPPFITPRGGDNVRARSKEAPGAGPSSASRADDETRGAPGVEPELLCSACGRGITRPRLRIRVQGAHEHTFINPEGVIYRIGTFSAAFGAAEVGPSSTYFSWFSGHAWRVLVCLGCGVHLGWSFRSSESAFVGLILDRLREVGA